MPHRDGNRVVYSTADIRKKLMAATSGLNKNRLQAAVYLVHDAIGMIQKLHPEAVGQPVALGGQALGAKEGTEGKGFAREVIAEPIGTAIALLGVGDVPGQQWDMAVTELRRALAMMQQRAESLNKSVDMRPTPPELARHVDSV